MKKKILTAVVLTAVLSLSACGGKQTSNSSANNANNANSTNSANAQSSSQAQSTSENNSSSVLQSSVESPANNGSTVNVSEFKYKNDDGGIEITDSTNTDENVIIPSEIDGKTVVSISNANGTSKALFPNAKKITLPETLTEIDDYAFANCAALTEINIPSRVDDIGDCAFKCCKSLTEIVIPPSVEDIGDYAFEGCTNLSAVTFSNGTKELGKGAFGGCTSLLNINLPDTLKELEQDTFDKNTAFTVTYKGISYTPDNISELYEKLR